MSLRRRLRALALGAGVALAAALAGAPVDAVAAPPGSKNFTPPSTVPNYFSNESGPFQGGATARAAQPAAGPAFAAPAPRRAVAIASSRYARHHAGRAANARGRLRLARGRPSAHRPVVLAHMARSGKAVATRSRPHPGNGRRVARTAAR